MCSGPLLVHILEAIKVQLPFTIRLNLVHSFRIAFSNLEFILSFDNVKIVILEEITPDEKRIQPNSVTPPVSFSIDSRSSRWAASNMVAHQRENGGDCGLSHLETINEFESCYLNRAMTVNFETKVVADPPWPP